MAIEAMIQPGLLGRINEWRVLRTIQQRGSLSRADLARLTGITAPTASKASGTLLRQGWLVEEDALDNRRGRPSKKLRLRSEQVQILGVVIDTPQCQLITSRLDGALSPEQSACIPTPRSYVALLDTISHWAQQQIAEPGRETWGLCLCMPGLIDHTQQRGLLSPNVPLTDGQTPALDLAERLGIPCKLLQEQHALCLAERYDGDAQTLDDFALMDLSTGVALPVVSRGRLFTGHRGLAGELGHLTVNVKGRLCGCGNTGCLETEISDPACLRCVSEARGREVTFAQAVALLNAQDAAAWSAMSERIDYLAIGVAAALHLFNPQTLFLHGRFVRECPEVLERLRKRLVTRTLPPALADCCIVLAQGSKAQGVVAGMIEYLIDSRLPKEILAIAPKL